MIASLLVALSAAILLALGTAHLVLTFHGPKLTPRDPELRDRMAGTHPVITRETTMWKAWLGFNASHSSAAMLFGLIYGYLALAERELLFASPFLLAVGFAMLAGWTLLGRLYWFRVPYWNLIVASLSYAAGVIVSRL